MSTPADSEKKSLIRLPIPLKGAGLVSYIETVKRAFGLEGVLDMTLTDQGFIKGDTLVYFSFTKEVTLAGAELGEADGVVTDFVGNLALCFDSGGELRSFNLRDVTKKHIEDQKASLVSLLRKEQVYFAKPEEAIDIPKLMSKNQEFYVQANEQGIKRVHRAFAR